MNIIDKIEQLQNIFNKLGTVTVAVSGGVDSMMLAYVAHQTLGTKAKMVHAISSAVPGMDTKRIETYANRFGWQLELVHSGEMSNINYRKNPVNRCYYCKSCLYSTLKALNHGQVVSGTNLDDLSDYRPGLTAAKEKGISHPFVEAQIDKNTIRTIARYYELNDLSDLPASPCLASRVETGVYINPKQLDLINRVETMLRSKINTENIRCRLQSQKIVIEVDAQQLNSTQSALIESLITDTKKMIGDVGLTLPVQLAPYQRGSAFVGAV